MQNEFQESVTLLSNILADSITQLTEQNPELLAIWDTNKALLSGMYTLLEMENKRIQSRMANMILAEVQAEEAHLNIMKHWEIESENLQFDIDHYRASQKVVIEKLQGMFGSSVTQAPKESSDTALKELESALGYVLQPMDNKPFDYGILEVLSKESLIILVRHSHKLIEKLRGNLKFLQNEA